MKRSRKPYTGSLGRTVPIFSRLFVWALVGTGALAMPTGSAAALSPGSAAPPTTSSRSWLELTRVLLDGGADSGFLPQLGFRVAPDGKWTMSVGEPLVLEAFRRAKEQDPAVVFETTDTVARLLNLQRVWQTAISSDSYRAVLHALSNAALEEAATNGLAPDRVLDFFVQSNLGGYRDLIAIAEEGFGSGFGEEVPQKMPPGCWDCRYHDECWWGVCCAPGGSGCCVQIPCPLGPEPTVPSVLGPSFDEE